MFIDFATTNTGDLLFQEQDINSTSLKITFALSKTKATKVVFDFIEFDTTEPSSHALRVNFDLVKKTANKSVKILKDTDALSQLLTMRLKSSLGELPLRPGFGSQLSLLKHKDINSGTLSALQTYVKDSISDIVNNPIVEARPYIDYNNGYKQTIIVKIYSNDKNLLNYIVER